MTTRRFPVSPQQRERWQRVRAAIADTTAPDFVTPMTIPIFHAYGLKAMSEEVDRLLMQQPKGYPVAHTFATGDDGALFHELAWSADDWRDIKKGRPFQKAAA